MNTCRKCQTNDPHTQKYQLLGGYTAILCPDCINRWILFMSDNPVADRYINNELWLKGAVLESNYDEINTISDLQRGCRKQLLELADEWYDQSKELE